MAEPRVEPDEDTPQSIGDSSPTGICEEEETCIAGGNHGST